MNERITEGTEVVIMGNSGSSNCYDETEVYSRSNSMCVHNELRTEDVDLRDINTLQVVEKLSKRDHPDIHI